MHINFKKAKYILVKWNSFWVDEKGKLKPKEDIIFTIL